MANYKATGKKSYKGPELVQRVRAALLNALDVLDQRGKKISDILADEFEQNPLKFMDLASKYCPKDVHVHEGETALDRLLENVPDEQLADFATGIRQLVAAQNSGSSRQKETKQRASNRSNKVH